MKADASCRGKMPLIRLKITQPIQPGPVSRGALLTRLQNSRGGRLLDGKVTKVCEHLLSLEAPSAIIPFVVQEPAHRTHKPYTAGVVNSVSASTPAFWKRRPGRCVSRKRRTYWRMPGTQARAIAKFHQDDKWTIYISVIFTLTMACDNDWSPLSPMVGAVLWICHKLDNIDTVQPGIWYLDTFHIVV